MRDNRLVKLALLLVNYSMRVKKGDLFRIVGTPESIPFIKEVFRESLKRGAYPFVRMNLEEIEEIFYKEASRNQLEYVSEMIKLEMKKIDSYLAIKGSGNTRTFSNVNPEKMAVVERARRPLSERIYKSPEKGGIRWSLVYYPTNSGAQDAGMSLIEWEDFIFKGCMVHKKNPVAEWKQLGKKQAKIVKTLNKVKTIRFVSSETDLSMSVKGKEWINCCGEANMPDGEIFTSPVENSLEGTIKFTFPSRQRARDITDIKITFKKGKVIKASAFSNEDVLHSILNTDKGAKYCGEISFGTNPYIQKFVNNTLFDEKIGGTVHLALGNAIEEAGGKNKSAIHWDIVTDMRKSGEVYADGKLIYKNGKFV